MSMFRPSPAGRIHAGRIESSPRLQRVLAVLQRGGKYTTRDLIEQAHVAAVNSIVSELRRNGFDIGCKRISRTQWQYWLEG